MNRSRVAVVALGAVVLLAFGAGAATIDVTVSGTADGGDPEATGPDTDDEEFDPVNATGEVFASFEDRFFENRDDEGEEGSAVEQVNANEEQGESRTLLDVPPFGLALIAIVAVVLAAVVFRRWASGESTETSHDDPDYDGFTLAGVGEAAGRAADRMETETTPENAVYRAWLDMTRYLDVERPNSTTPAEFARSAVEAGMAREDVRTLTDAFEQVRYGDAPVTEERERRAAEAFRHIEETYAGDEVDAGRYNRRTGGGGDE